MIDSFIRDRLPPPERQPEFLFTLPELQYPERLNAAVELIDRNDANAPALRMPSQAANSIALFGPRNRTRLPRTSPSSSVSRRAIRSERSLISP